ncbi:hypothetical protein EDD86DRAFT_75735 [Gorgonomyces haynaldii]|nr:hypothetical protein EDD86DRAFT_75735 [Gorgonomyces haynaldii]
MPRLFQSFPMSLALLPPELINMIMGYLNYKDYSRWSRTCKSIYQCFYPLNVNWDSNDFGKALLAGQKQLVVSLIKSMTFRPMQAFTIHGVSWLPLEFAARLGAAEIVSQLLLDPRVDPSQNNQRPLRVAASYGHCQVVKLLLQDPRVEPNANDDEAVRMACSFGHYAVVQLLLLDERVGPSSIQELLFTCHPPIRPIIPVSPKPVQFPCMTLGLTSTGRLEILVAE